MNSNLRETAPHFSRGHSYGAMVQHYMLTGSEDQALYHAWLAYEPEVEDSTKGITLATTLGIFEKIKDQLDLLRLEWEVAIFNGKPAIELSFKLLIEDDFIYIGFVDLVVRNKISGIYAVFEEKTTSITVKDVAPLYKNSNQAIVYSAVLDQIAGEELTSYAIVYPVMQDVKGTIAFHVFTFQKTLIDRLQAFLSIGLDVERIRKCETLGVYPRRGSKCMAYNKVCAHYGTCTLQGADMPAERQPNNDSFDFTFKLEDIIANHLRRV
jgi:hypothetical protein